jgi:hypothetical protein
MDPPGCHAIDRPRRGDHRTVVAGARLLCRGARPARAAHPPVRDWRRSRSPGIATVPDQVDGAGRHGVGVVWSKDGTMVSARPIGTTNASEYGEPLNAAGDELARQRRFLSEHQRGISRCPWLLAFPFLVMRGSQALVWRRTRCRTRGGCARVAESCGTAERGLLVAN